MNRRMAEALTLLTAGTAAAAGTWVAPALGDPLHSLFGALGLTGLLMALLVAGCTLLGRDTAKTLPEGLDGALAAAAALALIAVVLVGLGTAGITLRPGILTASIAALTVLATAVAALLAAAGRRVVLPRGGVRSIAVVLGAGFAAAALAQLIHLVPVTTPDPPSASLSWVDPSVVAGGRVRPGTAVDVQVQGSLVAPTASIDGRPVPVQVLSRSSQSALYRIVAPASPEGCSVRLRVRLSTGLSLATAVAGPAACRPSDGATS